VSPPSTLDVHCRQWGDPIVSNPPSATRQGIAWSAFLGVSWTWCIGMFLPVLLARDFGVAGFLVFAIPNILGAALMGRVLPDAQSSRRFVDLHGGACTAFSGVTIVFHLFVLQWVIGGLIGSAAFLITGGLLAIMLLIFLNEAATLFLSWFVLAGSLAAFAYVVAHAPEAMRGIHLTGPQPTRNLLGLAAVCLLGFSLCPYLDLTFHRARQSTTPAGGIVAFAVGFGGCFASMILFTLWYARLLDPERWPLIPRPIAWAIALHICAQSAFTIAAHVRSLVMNSARQKDIPLGVGLSAGLLIAAAFFLIFLAEFPPDALPGHRNERNSEDVYRMFMGFYGLIFPAYLWICMRRPSRRALVTAAVVIALVAPMFWIGFIEEKMLWLIPGVLLILFARLLIPAGPLPGAQSAVPTPIGHAPPTFES
jgi:hypothetical protein